MILGDLAARVMIGTGPAGPGALAEFPAGHGRRPFRRNGADVFAALALGLALTLPAVEEPEHRPDLVRWRTISDGEAEARTRSRPVLYFFTGDWCPPCVALKRTVFSDPAVAELIEANFVPIAVDDVRGDNQEASPEVAALAFRFLVSRLPTLVVTRPGGGPAVSEDGAPVHSRMVEFLRTARARLEALEKAGRKPEKLPS